MEANRAQPSMDNMRIRILIDKHRQHLTKKVEESFGRAGEEWAAQAVELHILRTDAENRRKEGRGFYKMDEASIQTLHADLTEDYHTLVKSHTAVVKIHHYVRIGRRNHRGSGPEGFSGQTCNTSKI